jgi:hypothetical protein
MILLSLPLLINYVGRLQAEARMASEVQLRAERVKKSEITLIQLRDALEYARSDAFTERYAREQARYAKPGEVVVVPSGVQDPATPHRAWWEDFVHQTDEGAQPVVDAQPVSPTLQTIEVPQSGDNSR